MAPKHTFEEMFDTADRGINRNDCEIGLVRHDKNFIFPSPSFAFRLTSGSTSLDTTSTLFDDRALRLLVNLSSYCSPGANYVVATLPPALQGI